MKITLDQVRLLISEYLTGNDPADVFWCRQMNKVASYATELEEALARSEFDISPCVLCGKPVVCIPDGMACCCICGTKETETENNLRIQNNG